MNFAFCRDYRFENEEDSKKFFDKVPTNNKVGLPIKKSNSFSVTIYENEHKHIEIDSFAWENKSLWWSYQGSFEIEFCSH